MIRMDRFVLLEILILKRKVVGEMVGERVVPDLNPIWILANNSNEGPKLFKVFNVWFECPDFEYFVENVWNSSGVHGKCVFVMKEKLKLLR